MVCDEMCVKVGEGRGVLGGAGDKWLRPSTYFHFFLINHVLLFFPGGFQFHINTMKCGGNKSLLIQ